MTKLHQSTLHIVQEENNIRLSGGNRTSFHRIYANDVDPLVSVITVVRNGEGTIARCIESVLAQTYGNVEHIIVDGASTDQTVSILRSYGEDIALWISEPDKGIYNAINKGISLACGAFYIPLGCDDTLTPTGIESLVRRAKDNLVICGKVRFVDTEQNLKKLIYNHSAGVLIDIRAHDKLGMYDETYLIAADTKFLRLAARASYVKNIKDVVGEFTVGGASSNYAQTVHEHARAMQESGSWGAVRAFLWRAPRLVWAAFR